MIYTLVTIDLPRPHHPNESVESTSPGAAAKMFADRGYVGLATIMSSDGQVSLWHLDRLILAWARPAP